MPQTKRYSRPVLSPARAAWLAAALCLFLAAGCAKIPPAPGSVRATVADLDRLPQDAGAFVPERFRDRPLFSPQDSAKAFDKYVAAWFSPWGRMEPEHDAHTVNWGFRAFTAQTMYGANTLPKPMDWLDRLRVLSGMDGYPNACGHAVATAAVSLRVLPTNLPAFRGFDEPGEGYPFDYMQNTLVPAGTPLFLSHYSRDKAWALVETHNAYGWMPVSGLALVDRDFETAYRTGGYAAFVRDGFPVIGPFGLHRFFGRVGMILPAIHVLGEDDGVGTVLFPARDEKGRAVLLTATVPGTQARYGPLSPTPGTLAGMANSIMGRPYGWGGMYGLRDCSAMVMDLMAPLGIVLPRNSRQQAGAGRLFDLSGLDPAAKKKAILERGVPFMTLINKPGHVMLYIGSRDGEPMVLHTTWGVKTRDSDGREGRRVIGRTAVTGLEPGAELPALDRPGGLLVNAVTGMTVLWPRPADQDAVSEASDDSGE